MSEDKNVRPKKGWITDRLYNWITDRLYKMKWTAVKQLLAADYHIITDEQIYEAMREPVMVEGKLLYIEAEPLGIVPCEKCKGMGRLWWGVAPFGDNDDCPDCAEWGNKGWVVKT